MSITLKRFLIGCAMAYVFAPSFAAGADLPQADTIASTELAALDNRLQQFSSRFYAALVRGNQFPKIETIDLLARTVDRYRDQHRPVDAAATVISNLALVEKNADTTPIIDIVGLLLENNEWNTASQLYNKVKKQGDKSLVSNVSLSLAKYYFARDQWKETIGILESTRSDLAPEDYANALLMQGVALQHLLKHRVALTQYAKIPPSSRYYPAARLNMAVANIRQDWWTDAHIIINDLLNDKTHARDSELTDRLYTVLGYSLLQQQYFRNSRDAFRNVSLDGKYTDKALLGIALTAAYQEDYIGALNAVKILKEKKMRDLPVDEANLLIPYFYERLKQMTTASTGYDDAIKYYESRIDSIKGAMPHDADTLRAQIAAGNSSTVTISDEIVNLGDRLPRFVFDNVRILARFSPYLAQTNDTALAREYDTLNADYRNLLQRAAQIILDEKISFLTHYMNQSRYGLVRMQDHDTATPQ